MQPDALLLAALQSAPRRYRMPPLPASAADARDGGTDTALAFAIEAAREAKARGAPPPPAARELFTAALAAFLREALVPAGGDPAFQALLLQAQQPQVREFVQLSAQEPADRRAVRAAIDAVAHPGKLRALPAGPERELLARLHELAADAAWPQLREALEQAPPALAEPVRATPALQRLVRAAELLPTAHVQRYLELRARRGPLAGSHAAAAQGRASARIGDDAEEATLAAFAGIATLLDAHAARGAPHRVLRGLHTPRGFPGEAAKAKSEWDAAIVRGTSLVLLAEVKATPAAASSDLSRLRRGLLRLAQAQPERSYRFRSVDGEVEIGGASLRALQPPAHGLPPHVIYCCTATAEAQAPVLGAASKSVLAMESASVDFALRLARGEAPPERDLVPVWDALQDAPRLRATLHQYETAQAVRACMLHPDDLLAAVSHLASGAGRPSP